MTTAAPEPTPFPATPPNAPPPAGRSGADVLGLAWLNGTLHAAVFRRKKILASWSEAAPVNTMEEFAAALDKGLVEVDFNGTEVFLLLENDRFVHQRESAPAFSDSAARSYLLGRVARHQAEHQATLWVSQPTVSVQQERAFLLHLLPRNFYTALNQVLVARRLDLTRILPLVVPIQRELDRFPIAKGRPVLVAVEAGNATVVMVAKMNGQMAFARTILASWSADPGRIGLEINRSVLYAKQQFGLTVERIWLLGENNQSTAAVNDKCGTGKQITVLPTKPIEWLQSVAKLSPQQPVNLLAEYLQRKRRLALTRTLLLVASWLVLLFLAADNWTRAQAWSVERKRLDGLRTHQAVMSAERDKLAERNVAVEHNRALIRQVADDRLPPVPGKFLASVGSALADEMRLTDFSVRWDAPTAAWTFRLDGTVEADEETVRDMLRAVQKNLTKAPWFARFNDGARTTVSVPGAPGSDAAESQRFSVEGVLLEK